MNRDQLKKLEAQLWAAAELATALEKLGLPLTAARLREVGEPI